MRAIILTKSAMNKDGKKGACTTAYVPETQKIVRFVTDRVGSPIPYFYANRYNKLSIVDIQALEHCPIGPQTENILIDPELIRVVGSYDQDKLGLLRCCSEVEFDGPRILGDGYKKFESVESFRHSVEVKFVREFRIEKGEQFGDAKAHFKACGVQHRYFSVTDFDYDIRHDSEKNRLELGDAWVVSSIPSSPYIRVDGSGEYYVFIAAIYPIDTLQ